MFDDIKKCLNEYEKIAKKCDGFYEITREEEDFIEYFDLRLAEAIMKDLRFYGHGEKIAKVILATLGLSNEIKVKIE